jgi:hypothetical protein
MPSSLPWLMTGIMSLNFASSVRPSSSFWYFGSLRVLFLKSYFLLHLIRH